MDQFRKANQAWWDERAPIHAKSKFYDLDGFKAGRETLEPVEIEEVGDVQGKTLLHLQCHIGLDTISWARRGAIVTGVDFSANSIAVARQLCQEMNIGATFVQSDLYALPHNLDGQFDMVYTSSGVLCWLNDIKGWAEVIAHFLKPGGTFYIHEYHPTAMIFDDESEQPAIKYSYFHNAEPLIFDSEGSYADGTANTHNNKTYEWNHSLGDIINALINVGLRIEFLHEFSMTNFHAFPWLKGGDNQQWYFEGLPLMFSLKAQRDDT